MSGDGQRSILERNEGIDLLRLGLILCVIVIHAMALVDNADRRPWHLFVIGFCNAAVPVYFVAAGYFLRPNRKSALACVTQPLLRLLPIHVFWMAVYYTMVVITTSWWPVVDVHYLLTGGVAFHLWFLPALAMALMVVGLLRRFLPNYVVWAIVLALALAALMRGSYHAVLHLSGEGQRSNLLAAPLLVNIGATIRTAQISLGKKYALLLALCAYVLQMIEFSIIAWVAGTVLIVWPYVVSTFLFGTAVFLLGTTMTGRRVPAFAITASRSTLGIYAVHLLVMNILATFLPNRQPVTVLFFSVVVLIVSSAIAQAMYQVPLLRRIVS